jgi:hypothetical protein
MHKKKILKSKWTLQIKSKGLDLRAAVGDVQLCKSTNKDGSPKVTVFVNL